MKAFKPIQGYEKEYFVNKNGEIFSNKNEKILKPFLKKGRKTNYYQISLSKNGKVKKYLIHRLTAIVFILNPLNKPQINHKDGNGLNNNISNLEWATNGENIKHAWDNGLISRKKSPEMILKMKKSLKGRKAWNKGLKGCQSHSETTRKKIAKSMKQYQKSKKTLQACSGGVSPYDDTAVGTPETQPDGEAKTAN